MSQPHFPHQPTLRNLLSCEALSEAQVVYGQDLLDRPVWQVATSLSPPPRPGSLLVTRAGTLGAAERSGLSELAGLVVIRPYAVPVEAAGGSSPHAPAGPVASLSLDLEMQRLVKQCADAQLPLLTLTAFAEPGQA